MTIEQAIHILDPETTAEERQRSNTTAVCTAERRWSLRVTRPAA